MASSNALSNMTDIGSLIPSPMGVSCFSGVCAWRVWGGGSCSINTYYYVLEWKARSNSTDKD